MSTDHNTNKQVHYDRALADISSSSGTTFSAGADFSAETEISDETLEAVAGGAVVNLDLSHTPVGQS